VTRDELVEAVTEALYLSPGLEVLPPDTDWEHVVAAATVDVVLPMVTEAVAAAIGAKRRARLEEWADIGDDAHEAGMEFAFRIAERIAREWRPE